MDIQVPAKLWLQIYITGGSVNESFQSLSYFCSPKIE